MSVFTELELDYLTADRLARMATVGADGTPHVVPVGIGYDSKHDAIEVGGFDLPRTKKFRDIARQGVAALVVDDVLPPWRPRGIEIRARAVAINGPDPVLRLHPVRIVSWGLESDRIGDRRARTVEAP